MKNSENRWRLEIANRKTGETKIAVTGASPKECVDALKERYPDPIDVFAYRINLTRMDGLQKANGVKK